LTARDQILNEGFRQSHFQGNLAIQNTNTTLKYRKLTLTELEGLREDYIRFLAANSITADDWVKLKNENQEATDKLIELFSDIVWEKILSKIQYVRVVSQTALRVMYFGEDKAHLIQLKLNSDDFNFTNPETIKQIAEGSIDLLQFDPEMIQGSKTYSTTREYEVFLALEQGGEPTEEVFWRALKSMIPQ
jgi:hypothetical protein